MISPLLAGALLAVFMIVEKQLRVGGDAKQIQLRSDKSTLVLGICYGININLILIGALQALFQFYPLQERLGAGPLGLLVMACGLAVRVAANRQLGKYYTRSLHTYSGHRIVSSGLYKHIRHPGYLGLISVWIGAGISSGSALLGLLVTILTCSAYAYRIALEEKKLSAELGAPYDQYVARTKRLIPFVY